MLRRTLLSYTPAISVTGLNIKGVNHEYSTIDGVKESVLQIMLNFKDLKFIGDLPERTQWISKKFKGVGKYYVEDLDLPAWVEILTEKSYLFEITDPKVELELSYRLEKWYRYLSLEELKNREKQESEEGTNIGTLLIDNDFKVVKNVTYRVEEVIENFSWEYNDYVEIVIEPISPKVDPKQLLSFAWEVVSSYTKMFVFDESYVDTSLLTDLSELEEETNEESELVEVKKTPIDSLTWLSERTRNALIKNNIEFVEDLEKKTKAELVSLKWVGKKAVDEIQQALEREGKTLGTK
jgi:DNA-directed RNA polymerase subunit alpha